jgi:hypothetical protein
MGELKMKNAKFKMKSVLAADRRSPATARQDYAD